MDVDFGSAASLALGMSDYLDHVYPDASWSRQYGQHLDGGCTRFYSTTQDNRQGFANGLTNHSSASIVFPDQIYTFHDHQDSHTTTGPANNQSIDVLQPQHFQSGHPYFRLPHTIGIPHLRPRNHPPAINNAPPSQDAFADYKGHGRYTPDLHSIPALAVPDLHPVQTTKVWTCQPYAKLIYEALRKAPGHRMVLKDIYTWFERHTDKPQTSNRSGWKNSIRHNLSMNAAFEKIESRNDTDDGKKTYIWALSVQALATNGVQSTTRYRKHSGKKTHQQTSRHRVAKKTKSQPIAYQSSFKTEHTHTDLVDDDMVLVKQEINHSNPVERPEDSSSAWSSQAHDKDISQYDSTGAPRWENESFMDYDFLDYNLADRMRRMAFPNPHLSHRNYEDREAMQQTVPDEMQHHCESPTPSMTTTQSPFGHHEDNELYQQHPQIQQEIEPYTEFRMSKLPDHVIPAIYRSHALRDSGGKDNRTDTARSTYNVIVLDVSSQAALVGADLSINLLAQWPEFQEGNLIQSASTSISVLIELSACEAY